MDLDQRPGKWDRPSISSKGSKPWDHAQGSQPTNCAGTGIVTRL